MADFVMEIGGCAGQVRSLFDSTADYCRNYLTDRHPDFSFAVTREHLTFEQQDLDQEADREGMKRRRFSEPFLERAAIQRAFADFLFDRGSLLVHGSTVAVDGKAYLFTAPCGTGKSTHTRLWREAFPDRAIMVNDDKPFVLLDRSPIAVCGTPWSGKHGLDTNITIPLQGICILARGPENRIRRILPQDALAMLLHQSYCPPEPEKARTFQALAEKLANNVPLWQMDCTKDIRAAEIAFAAMSEDALPRSL